MRRKLYKLEGRKEAEPDNWPPPGFVRLRTSCLPTLYEIFLGGDAVAFDILQIFEMGVLKTLVIVVLSLSFIVFIALFGRLPAFRYDHEQLPPHDRNSVDVLVEKLPSAS